MARRVGIVGTLSRETSSMTPRTSRSGWSRTVPAGSACRVEAGELCERRLAVEGAGRIGGGQVDAGVVDAQDVALGRERGVESASVPVGSGRTSPVRSRLRGTGSRFTGAPSGRRSTSSAHRVRPLRRRGRSAPPRPPTPRRAPSAQLVQGAQERRPGRHPVPSGRGAPPPARAGPGGSPRTRRTPTTSPWPPASRASTRFPLSAARDTSWRQLASGRPSNRRSRPARRPGPVRGPRGRRGIDPRSTRMSKFVSVRT